MYTHMYAHMYARCISPTEGLTWDDVCQLWDDGVYTADDVKKIAALYFEGAELSAVLEVVEKVEDDSPSLEIMNTDSGGYPSQPADTSSARGNFERAWRVLH